MTRQLPPALESDERFNTLLNILEQRLNALDVKSLLVYLVQNVQPGLLPILAEQFSLFGWDGWSLAESDEARRQLILKSIELHRLKGTPWAIKEVVRRFGFGEIELIEGLGDLTHDGNKNYNGLYVHRDAKSWAKYRIILKHTITNEQSKQLRQALIAFAPARCQLTSLEFTSVPIRYNKAASYDGNYNHGSVLNG